ncbi:MAG: hypothetical protein BWY66_01057 [bacterium ADurb.Bin374]|nr:MAG: hypothetical protein BWY66_01057 [bacterium ADurb.Bin374]
MDFRENEFITKAVWSLPSKIELTWRNELLKRVYEAATYPDFKFIATVLSAAYAKPKKYDWLVEAGYRKFSHERATVAGWNDAAHPLLLAKVNFVLRDDLKLQLSASTEKTFYRSFDTLAQELLWDFTKPVTITDFFGSLVYDF